MTPQTGYVEGMYKVVSFNVPIQLDVLLDEYVRRTKGKKSELVSKAICEKILCVSFEEVNAKNAELYPKRVEAVPE